VTAISQQLDDFLATTSGQAVLKNSSTRLLLLQTAETLAALEQHLQLTAVERTRLLACARGEGLLLLGRQRVFVRLEASPDEHRLCHTDAAAHEARIKAVAPHLSLYPAASLSGGTPAPHAAACGISPVAVSVVRQERGSDQMAEAQVNATPVSDDVGVPPLWREAASDPADGSAVVPASLAPSPPATATVADMRPRHHVPAPPIPCPIAPAPADDASGLALPQAGCSLPTVLRRSARRP
jgi:hypothetical protein